MTAIDPRTRADAAPEDPASRDQVRTTVWRSQGGIGEPFNLEDLSEIKDEPDVLFWVDLLDVHDGDYAMLWELAEELGFPPDDVKLAVNGGTRPKASRYATHTFIATYATTMDTNRIGEPFRVSRGHQPDLGIPAPPRACDDPPRRGLRHEQAGRPMGHGQAPLEARLGCPAL